MKHNWIAATFCVAFCFLATFVSPQGSTNRIHIGVPQDWSHRHIVFSREGLLQHPDLLYREPRVLHQAILRWQHPDSTAVGDIDPAAVSSATSHHRDWSVGLPGHVAANMFPAKYSFDPGLPADCAGDFVVFGLTNAGVTGGAANLVAFNNLYAGTLPPGICGSAPTPMFAYNVTTVGGSGIQTSPVLSLDGQNIAFVESGAGRSVFHVLTWAPAKGTPTAAAVPNQTSLTLHPFANNTTSSPWIDYQGHIAYVATDDGRIHKITGVFTGTPAEATAPWPIKLTPAVTTMTSPVVSGNLLLVGGNNGRLYQVDTTTGAFTSAAIGTAGFQAAPILDVTSGTAFVVNSDNSTTASGTLVQLNTASLATISTAIIGVASASGTAVNLWEPALSDSYFNNPSTGQIKVCGTGNTDVSPYLYTFDFNSSAVLQTSATQAIHLTSSTNARCTAITEFFHCSNTNCTAGTDYFFFGITTECTGTGTSGCVIARSPSAQPASVDIPGGPSGIVVDNYSSDAQASSIYFMGEGVGNNTAYKYTQNGLQ